VLLAVAVTVLVADITSKVIVVATLSGRSPVRLLGGLLTLRVDRNPGAAFSIGTSMTIVFTAIAVGVIVFILRTSRRIRSTAWAVTLGLLLGGATGNLTDRLLRSPGPLRGYVVDWIQLPHWPVFNVADSAIVCGGILAVLLAARGLSIDGTGPERTARAPGCGLGSSAGPGTVGPGPSGPSGPGSSAGPGTVGPGPSGPSGPGSSAGPGTVGPGPSGPGDPGGPGDPAGPGNPGGPDSAGSSTGTPAGGGGA
jgi:lipoprotein signal peptidase